MCLRLFIVVGTGRDANAAELKRILSQNGYGRFPVVFWGSFGPLRARVRTGLGAFGPKTRALIGPNDPQTTTGNPKIQPHGLQGGFCRRRHRHKNTDPKIGPGGWESRSGAKGKRPTTARPTINQGPCPDLRDLHQSPCRIS